MMKKILVACLAVTTLLLLTQTVSFSAMDGEGYFPIWMNWSSSIGSMSSNVEIFNADDTTAVDVTITAYRMDGDDSVVTSKTVQPLEMWNPQGFQWITGDGFDEGTTGSFAGGGLVWWGGGRIDTSAATICSFVNLYRGGSYPGGFSVPVFDDAAGDMF